MIDELLVPARRKDAQFIEADDHACLDFFENPDGAAGEDLPKFGIDLLTTRLRAFLPRVHAPVGEFRLPPHIGILVVRSVVIDDKQTANSEL